MTDAADTAARARRDPMSEAIRQEVMAEVLGDVYQLQQSVAALATMIQVSDERLTVRIKDLLAASKDFANVREGAIAELSAQASIATQRRITDTLGGMLSKVDATMVSIGGVARESQSRRLLELLVVGVASAALVGAAMLVGVWAFLH